MPRVITGIVLALILVTGLLVLVRLSGDPAYFAQPQAHTYVVRLFAILLAYSVAVLFVTRRKGLVRTHLFRAALVFGLISGLLEILTIASENALLASPLPALWGMLSVFATWGLAGSWATVRRQSILLGWWTAMASAALGMLLGVAGGVGLELFIAPTNPAVVATWPEFQRSAWTDPGAFQIANTLDSAFGHLLLAPVVAAIVGGIGCGVSRGLWPVGTRSVF